MAAPVTSSPAPSPQAQAPAGQAPLVTPTDDTSGVASQRRKIPNRGKRKRVLGEGEGDYCIYEILGKENAFKVAPGSLIPIPTVPRFKDTVSAIKWLRNESGDLLAGKQVMIFRACEILSLVIETKPTITIQTKPKVTVTAPAGSDEA